MAIKVRKVGEAAGTNLVVTVTGKTAGDSIAGVAVVPITVVPVALVPIAVVPMPVGVVMDLRDHAVRLMKRRGRHCADVATAKAKAAKSDQPDHFFLPLNLQTSTH
jgi:hypothetical protein